LLRRPCCTLRQCSTLLGMLQWFNLLSRPVFSALTDAYAFARLDDEVVRPVPGKVLDDFVCNMLLCPAWVAELDRPWSSVVMASDASQSFGLGVVASRLDRHVVRDLASKASDKHHVFRLLRRPGDEAPRERHGVETTIPLYKDDFKALISHRCRRIDHSGSLEAAAVVLGLRRLFRRSTNHKHRMVFLIDAQAVLGSLRKGRTSAGSIRRQIRQAAALQIAAGAKMTFLYVPSEDNPADEASRGTKPKQRIRKVRRVRPTKFDRHCELLRKFAKRIDSWPCYAPTSLSTARSDGSSSL
jgi:hypothetical protein